MPENIIQQIPALRTRAAVVPSTFNEANRTVELTFATERAVRTFDWDSWETIDEILVCDAASGDLSRLNAGAPLLDNHNSYGKSAEITIGVIERAWFEGGQGRCIVRFGNEEYDTKVMNKVRDGIITGISVGYRVQEYTTKRVEGKIPEARATKWEALEVSIAPVQADPGSRVRNDDGTNSVSIVDETPTPVPAASQPATPESPSAATETPTTTEPVAENTQTTQNTDNEITNLNDNNMPDPTTPTPAVVENPTVDASARAAIAAEERQRTLGIQTVCRSLELGAEVENELINGTLNLEQARSAALQRWEAARPVNTNPAAVQPQNTAEATRSAMSNALTLRINPAARSVMPADAQEAAAPFKNMSFLRLAEEALTRSGVTTAGMSQREIAQGALGARVRGYHHTTDFPLLLLDTVNRTLLAAYEIQARTFTTWARRDTVNDFRSVSRVRLSDLIGDLEKVREGEEYKYGSLGSSAESYKVFKYGKIIAITWEMIVNDDLSAFNRLPQAFAAKAAQLQSNLVYGQILENGFQAMADGNALFSAAHGNFTGTAANQTAGGTALSEASLTVAYTLFRNQKTDNGDFLNITPKYLVVGPKNEFLAGKLTSANYTPNTQAQQPVGALTGLVTVVDSRITNYEWFLMADPGMIDTVEYAFLAGEEELFIDTREGFNIDGIETKARMIFGTKAIDWRGMYRNNGAAPA